MIGQRFGKLVVVSFFGRDKYSHKIWNCECDCGNLTQALEHNLKNNLKKSKRSCGCLRRYISEDQNPIGKKIGKLNILKFLFTKNKKSYYECVCDCGIVKNISMSALQSGEYISCGCSQYSKQSKEKAKQTCLKKYGVDNPTKNKNIRLKAAKSCNNSYALNHWQTNEEIICQGSYEKKVAEFLNKNKIKYIWQPYTFHLPDGRTYTPDCHLTDKDIWIEIKGYFYNDAKEKWEWFRKENPNSELWDKEKLKELKIL